MDLLSRARPVQLHRVLPFQPDLNYHNPEMKEAMFEIARFWLNKGVDGFRLDIVSAIYEDPSRDNPISFRLSPSDQSLSIFFQHLKHNFLHEKSFEFATELRDVVNEFENPKRILIGESHGDEEVINRFCHHQGKWPHAIFLFKAISTPFKAPNYRNLLIRFEEHFPDPLLPTLVFANDRNRVISRLGGSVEKAKLLALFSLPAGVFRSPILVTRLEFPGCDSAKTGKGRDRPAAQLGSTVPGGQKCRNS